MDKKTMKSFAAVIFFGLFLYNLYGCIKLISYGMYPTYLIMYFVRLLCPLVCGFIVLGKKNSKSMGVIAIVYVVCAIVPMGNSIRYGSLSITGLAILLLFIGAYVIALKANDEKVFNVQDTVSENAKKQLQTEKQSSVYEQQLKDGIISQEEYSQLVNGKK